MNADKEQRLAAKVANAFSNAEYPGDGRIVVSDTYGTEDLSAALSGKQWAHLSVTELRHTVEEIGLLTPEAYRYFLPAYLIASLIHYDESDIVPDMVILLLTVPAESGKDIRFMERHEGLTIDQKRAIREFLEYLAEEHGREFLHDEPGTALSHYWKQF